MEAAATILIAEDDRAARQALQRALEFEGYTVVAAVDGGEALEKLTEHQPDAIVLDVMMPGLDGLDACRRIRSKGNRTPVLMLTARHEIADRVAVSTRAPTTIWSSPTRSMSCSPACEHSFGGSVSAATTRD